VHRWIHLDFVVAFPSQPEFKDSIDVDDVGAMDAEEGRGRQPRLDLFERLNVPVELLPRCANQAVIPLGLDVENLVHVQENRAPGFALDRKPANSQLARQS
jgi:hypothetical protein